MLENQIELKEQIHSQADRLRTMMPEVTQAKDAMTLSIYKDGAIDTKTKRLMAMTASLIHGCRACILYQAEQALNHGASVDELIESIGVAMSLGGTQAEGQATRVIGLLTEKGLI